MAVAGDDVGDPGFAFASLLAAFSFRAFDATRSARALFAFGPFGSAFSPSAVFAVLAGFSARSPFAGFALTAQGASFSPDPGFARFAFGSGFACGTRLAAWTGLALRARFPLGPHRKLAGLEGAGEERATSDLFPGHRPVLICADPTLFLGNAVAAQAPPPSARKRAIVAITLA